MRPRGNSAPPPGDYLSVRSRRTLLFRAVAATGLTLLGAALVAAPAKAHGQSLPDADRYRSTITAVAPPVPGLQLSVIQNGESITLTNHTGKTVMVIGYTGEDYLRITPTGVDENINSLSSFLNGSLVIQGLPQQLTSNAQQKPPEWKHVSDTPTFTWHDHRIHWMAQQRPPVVAADPRNPHRVFDWSMDLTVGGTPVTVKGALDWIGTPLLSGLAIALLVVSGVLVVAAVGLVALRRRLAADRRPVPAQPDPDTVRTR